MIGVLFSLVFYIGDAADLRANSFLEFAFRSAGKVFEKSGNLFGMD